jgi:hypothetical protein
MIFYYFLTENQKLKTENSIKEGGFILWLLIRGKN